MGSKTCRPPALRLQGPSDMLSVNERPETSESDMQGPDAGIVDRLYAFGSFVADPVTGSLRRDGVPVALTLKSFEVLTVLIERRGHVVEKDELLKRVWPDTIVEENNLARHISTLRKALDDHSHDHSYIVTVPGRGYRFVAPVQELPRIDLFSAPKHADGPPIDMSAGDVAGALTAAPRGLFPFGRTRGAGLVVTGLGIGIITSIVILADFGGPAPDATERRLSQLSFGGGLESDATWAPDGQAIAYSSDRAGNFDIWAQPVGDGQPVRLTLSPAHDLQPSWSSDGRSVAFRSERDGGGLFVVSANGGEERRITNFGYRPRWSPRDPRLLFYSSNIVRSKLYVVGANGEQLRRVLARFLDEFSSFRASWHPGGDRISIYGNHRQHGPSFWTTPIEGGAPVRSNLSAEVLKRLKTARVSLMDFNWSPTGDALYFEGRSEEAVNIWRVGVDPHTLEWRKGPERLTMGGGLDTNIALAPDGRKLAFTIRSERTRLWSFPFDPLKAQMLGDGERLSSRGADALYPDVPPDGTQVVYRTVRRGKQELWKRSLVDGQDRMLTAAGEMLAPRWSDDGKLLAFGRIQQIGDEGARMANSIVVISADGRNERLLTTPGPKICSPTDWSADGAWIVGACEHGPLGLRSICLLPILSAPRAQEQMRVIASDPERSLYQATYSPNRRWIGFNAAADRSDFSTIYVVAADGGQWTSITEGIFWDDKPRWSPDSRTIYFVSNRSGFLNVWARRFNPDTGKPFGDPFRVTNFENPSERVSSPVRTMDLALTSNRMILPIVEASGAVWILENVER